MPLSRDYAEFHKSIAEELTVTQNRIRNLISGRHWLSDGEHREAVLRKALRNHVPEAFHVGKGFISFEDSTSNQTDILITDKEHPTLFKDGDLRVVTPDAVRAIIEVKKSISDRAELKEYLGKLADNAAGVRKANEPISWCWAGLFVFDRKNLGNSGRILEHESVLEVLAEITHKKEERAINAIALGPIDFFRFWKNGGDISSPISGPVWHSYELDNLAFSYFVGNIVIDHLTWERSFKSQYAWFPVEGGKERHRKYYIGMSEERAQRFV
jgi:hypothetical protein